MRADTNSRLKNILYYIYICNQKKYTFDTKPQHKRRTSWHQETAFK